MPREYKGGTKKPRSQRKRVPDVLEISTLYGNDTLNAQRDLQGRARINNGDGTTTYYSNRDLLIYDDQVGTLLQLTGLNARLAEKNRAQVAQV